MWPSTSNNPLHSHIPIYQMNARLQTRFDKRKKNRFSDCLLIHTNHKYDLHAAVQCWVRRFPTSPLGLRAMGSDWSLKFVCFKGRPFHHEDRTWCAWVSLHGWFSSLLPPQSRRREHSNRLQYWYKCLVLWKRTSACRACTSSRVVFDIFFRCHFVVQRQECAGVAFHHRILRLPGESWKWRFPPLTKKKAFALWDSTM